MIDQHVPKHAPDNQQSGPGKPLRGPSWRRGVYRGETVRFDDGLWTVTKMRENGRIIYWRNVKGLVARTEATPSHPDYPREPTSAQRKQDALNDAQDDNNMAEWGSD